MTPTQIRHIKAGDMIDLEGDIFADPDHDNASYEMEYCTVESVEQETPGCYVVHFNNNPSVGFPPDHYVRLEQ